jgi:hypothetical protein
MHEIIEYSEQCGSAMTNMRKLCRELREHCADIPLDQAEGSQNANPLGTHHPLNTQIDGTVPDAQSAVTTSTNVFPEQRPRSRSWSYFEENLHPPPRVRSFRQRLGQTTINEEAPSPPIVAPIPRSPSFGSLGNRLRRPTSANVSREQLPRTQSPLALESAVRERLAQTRLNEVDASPELVAPIPRSASFRFLGQLQARQPRFMDPLFNRDRIRIPPTPPSTSLATGPASATTPGGTQRQVQLPSRNTVRRAIRSLAVDSVEASRDRHESSDSSRTLANSSTDSGADADSESSRRNTRPPTRTAIIDGLRIDGASEIANAIRRIASNAAPPACEDSVFSPHRIGGPCPRCPPSGTRRPHFGTHIPHNETVGGPEEDDREIILSRYSRLSGGPVPGFEEDYFPSTDCYFGSRRANLWFGGFGHNTEPAEGEPGPSDYAHRRHLRRRRTRGDLDESDSSSIDGLIAREVEAEERQLRL